MAEAVQAFLLSHYLNSADALVEETLRQQAADEDGERQQRDGQADNGGRRSHALQPERLARTHSFHLDDGATGRFSRSSSRRVMPFTNEAVDSSSPIMRRASWVEAPLITHESSSPGLGLPRTPLRALSNGRGLQALASQRDLSQHLLAASLHGGPDRSDAVGVSTHLPASSAALVTVRSVRGAWGPVQSVRGTYRARPAISEGAAGAVAPPSPQTWSPQRVTGEEDSTGLQRSDASVILSAFGGGDITVDGDGGEGGGRGDGGDGSEDPATARRRRSREIAYRRVGTGLMSTRRRVSLSEDDAGGGSGAGASTSAVAPSVGSLPPALPELTAAAAAATSQQQQQQQQHQAEGDSNGCSCDAVKDGAAEGPPPNSSTAAAAAAAKAPGATTSTAALVKLLWPATAEVASGRATSSRVDLFSRLSPGAASSRLEVGPELQLGRGKGGLAPQLPGQVVDDDAEDTPAEAPPAPPPDHTPFLLQPRAGAAATATYKEVSWWLMASRDSVDTRGSSDAGGLRRRRRGWQRGSAGSGSDEASSGGGGGGGAGLGLPALAAVRAASLAAKWRSRTRRRERQQQQVERVPWHALVLDLWSVADKYIPLFQPSLGRSSWDLLMLVLLLYTSAVVPLQAGFRSVRHPLLDGLDLAVLAVFWVDILVQLRTVYIDETGELVRNTHHIAAHYASTWLPLDLVSSLPWAEIIRAVLKSSLRRNHDAGGLVTLLRVLRLLKLARLLRMFDRLRYANLIRLGRLFTLMLLVAHWTACIWHGMSEWLEGWPWIFDELHRRGEHGFLAHYSFSLYVSFVLVVGSDNLPTANNLERVFCIVMLIVGAVLYALIVSNMAVLAANLNSLSSRYRLKAGMVADALRYIGAPQRFRNRVADYFAFLAMHEHPGPEADAFLSELPRGLVEDIKWSLYSAPFHRMPLFAGCDEPFLAALQARLTLVAFTPGEVIFQEGDVGQHLYVVRKGVVLLRSTAGDMCGLLRPGEAFGELAVLPDLVARRRTCTAVAGRSADLVALAGRDLAAACKDHPQSAALVQERLMQQLEDRLQGTQWTWFINRVLLPYQLHGDADEPDIAGSGDRGGGCGGNTSSCPGVSFSSTCTCQEGQELSFSASMSVLDQQGGLGGLSGQGTYSAAGGSAAATAGGQEASSFGPGRELGRESSGGGSAPSAGARPAAEPPTETPTAGPAASNGASSSGHTADGMASAGASVPPTVSSSPRPVPPCATPEGPGPPAAEANGSNVMAAAVASLKTLPVTTSDPLWGLLISQDLIPLPAAPPASLPSPAFEQAHEPLEPALTFSPAREEDPGAPLGLDAGLLPTAPSHAATPAAAAAASLAGSRSPDVRSSGSGSFTGSFPSPRTPTRPSRCPSRLGRPGFSVSPHSPSAQGSGSDGPSSAELLRLETATTLASADQRRSLDLDASGPPQGPDASGQSRGEGHAEILSPNEAAEGQQQQPRQRQPAAQQQSQRQRLRHADGQQSQAQACQQLQQPQQLLLPPMPPAPLQALPSRRALDAHDSISGSRRLLRNLSELLSSLLDHFPGPHALQRMRTLSRGRAGASPNTSAVQVLRLTDEGGNTAGRPPEQQDADHHRRGGPSLSAGQLPYMAAGAALMRLPGRWRLSSHDNANNAGLRPVRNRDGGGAAAAGGEDAAVDVEGGLTSAWDLGGGSAAAVAAVDDGCSPLPGARQAAALQLVRTASECSGQRSRRAVEGGSPLTASPTASSPPSASTAAGPSEPVRSASRRQARRSASRLALGWSMLGHNASEDETSNTNSNSGGGAAGRSSDLGNAGTPFSALLPAVDANSGDGRGGIRSLVLRRRSRNSTIDSSGRWLSSNGAMPHRLASRVVRDVSDALAGSVAALSPQQEPSAHVGGELVAELSGAGSVDGVPRHAGGHPSSRPVSGSRPASARQADPRMQLQAALAVLARAVGIDPSPFQASNGASAAVARSLFRCAGGSRRDRGDEPAMLHAPSGASAPAATTAPAATGAAAAAAAAGSAASALEALLSQLGSRQVLLALADAIVRREGRGVPAVQEMLQQHGREVMEGAETRLGRVLGGVANSVEAIEQTVASLDESLHSANRRLAAIERDVLEAHGDGVLAGGLLGRLSREAFGGAAFCGEEDDEDVGVDGECTLEERLQSSGFGGASFSGGCGEVDPLTGTMLLIRPPSHGTAASRKASGAFLLTSHSGFDGTAAASSFSTSSLRDVEAEGQQSNSGGAADGGGGSGGGAPAPRASKGSAAASRSALRRCTAPAFSSGANASGSLHRNPDGTEAVLTCKGSGSLHAHASGASVDQAWSGAEGSMHGRNALGGGGEGSVLGRGGSNTGVTAPDGAAGASGVGAPPHGSYSARRKSLDAALFSRLQQEWQSTPQHSLSHSCSAGASLSSGGGGAAVAAAACLATGGDADAAAATAGAGSPCGTQPARERRRSKNTSAAAEGGSGVDGAPAAAGASGYQGQQLDANPIPGLAGQQNQSVHGPRSRRASLMMLQAGMLLSEATAAGGGQAGPTSPIATPLSAHISGVRQRLKPYVAVLDDSIVPDGAPATANSAGRHALHGLAPSERPGARRKATSPRQQQQLLLQPPSLQQQRPKRHRSNTADGLSQTSPGSVLTPSRRNSNTLPSTVGKMASALATLRAMSRLSGGGLGGGSASTWEQLERPSGSRLGSQFSGSRPDSQPGSRRGSRGGDSQVTSRHGSVTSYTDGEGHGAVGEAAGDRAEAC